MLIREGTSQIRSMSPTLSPAQQHALDALVLAARPGRMVTLGGGPGAGKTTVLRAAHERLGGILLGAEDLQRAIAGAPHPLAIEDALHALLSKAIDEHEVVLLDDLHHVQMVIEAGHGYPRVQLLALTITALAAKLERVQRTLVLASMMINERLANLGTQVAIRMPTAEDDRRSGLLRADLAAIVSGRFAVAPYHSGHETLETSHRHPRQLSIVARRIPHARDRLRRHSRRRRFGGAARDAPGRRAPPVPTRRSRPHTRMRSTASSPPRASDPFGWA